MDKIFKRRGFLKRGIVLGLCGLAPYNLLANNALSENDADVTNKLNLKELRKGRKITHRIIVAGDPHWGAKMAKEHPKFGKFANTVPYKEGFKKMINWLNEETDRKGTDLIVFNGDLINNNTEDLPIIKEKFSHLKSPYFVVHGNHDHGSKENWKNLWGYNFNHSFELGDYAIVLLNSASEKGRYECADNEWLKNQLKLYGEKAGILIFCHVFQHGRGVPFGIDCPSITETMMTSENLKMVTYSHSHTLDMHFPIIKDSQQLDTFFTGHLVLWDSPCFGYRVIEIYENGSIGTYAYNPKEKTVMNYNLLS